MREFGSEHPVIVLPDDYFESMGEFGREMLYLRSGREALLLAAMSVKAGCKGEPVILFPAYCCWSMSAPFEKAGWKIVYYRLNEDLTVDTDYLKQLLDEHKPQAVLTMNFFGSASTAEAVRIVQENNANLDFNRVKVIEDFSHCTFSLKQIHNSHVDIYVSSIRKSIGVCDGSVILSNIPLKMEYIQDELKDFADKRYVAQTEKDRYRWSNDQKKKHEFLSAIRESESIINEFDAVRPISERAKQMLALVNGEEIAYARRENMRHLMELLKGKVRMILGLERSLEGAPFSLPILVEHRDEVQGQLAKKGIYAPVLWPICEEAQHVCPVSKMMGEQMLSIPIDQRYDWNDIEVIANIILEVC